MLAITDVESAGVAFWKIAGVNRPPIRFEGHYFYARLKGAKLKKAIQAGLASPNVGGVINPKSYAARYELLSRAKDIDENAAIESTSWGLGQVMGTHWKDLGFPTVQDLVKSTETVAGQVELMISFIEANGLLIPLYEKNWKSFARGYNGSGYYRNKYDIKMAEAYANYSTGVDTDAYKAAFRHMQTMLNAIGGYKLVVDGVTGPNTDIALRDFQLKNGLVVDGKYGPITREELEKQYVAIGKKTEQNVGATITATGIAGEVIMKAADQVLPFKDISPIISYLFIGLIIIGVLLSFKSIFWK